MEFVSDDYVYKMKPGACGFKNLEFDTILTHDSEGFRNRRVGPEYDVVAIGDSHTQGWGVGDDQTFSYLLESQFGYLTKNLGVASYATMRELEVLDKYGKDSRYVIVQYCDNDFSENLASNRLAAEDFRSQVEREWKDRIATYRQGKAMGISKPLHDLGVMLRDRTYTSKSTWRRWPERRSMQQEAAAFAQVISRFQSLLEGKRVLVFESADSGMNSPRFVETFGSELGKISWLHFKIIDATRTLNHGDYYSLDGHPNPSGHRKLAAAFAREISQWETNEPVLQKH
jgi:GDSL-like Lipase/Acylhydrolase